MKNISSDWTKGKADFFKLKGILKANHIPQKPYSPNSYFQDALSYPRNSKQIGKASYWEAHTCHQYFFSSHLSSTSFHLASIPPFTKTVLVQVTNDLGFPKPDGCFSILTLSVFSASFNNIDNSFPDGFDDITFFPCSYFLSSCSFSVFFLLALPALFQLLLLEYHWSWIGFLLFCPHSLRLEIPSLANVNLCLQPRTSLISDCKLCVPRMSHGSLSPIQCHAASFFFSLPTVNGTISYSVNTWNPRVILEFSFYSVFTPSQSAIPVNLPSKTYVKCIHSFHLHHCHLVQGTIISHLVCCSSLQAGLLFSFISSPIIHSLHSSQNGITLHHSPTQNS